MSADQRRTVMTDVLEQEVTVARRSSDGMVWLYAPQGVALTADEAWQVAQAMIADQEPADPVRCPKCGGPHPFHDPACVVHPDLIQDHNEQEPTMTEHDVRVAAAVARFRLDQAAYALACGVVDAEVWTPEGMVVPDREALVARFREARDAWIAADGAVRALEPEGREP